MGSPSETRPIGIQTDWRAASVISSPADTAAPVSVTLNSGNRELIETGPLLAQRILRGSTAADPDDIRSDAPHHAHERGGRDAQPLPKVGSVEDSTGQLV